jgi:hypothetical protein
MGRSGKVPRHWSSARRVIGFEPPSGQDIDCPFPAGVDCEHLNFVRPLLAYPFSGIRRPWRSLTPRGANEKNGAGDLAGGMTVGHAAIPSLENITANAPSGTVPRRRRMALRDSRSWDREWQLDIPDTYRRCLQR